MRNQCADTNGEACSGQTIGPLYRRHVLIDTLRYIGKEANRLDEVQSGQISQRYGSLHGVR